MKRVIFTLLIVALFIILITGSVFAAIGWQFVGMPSFSAGNVSDISIAMDGSTPYVAYKDFVNGFKATVMRFNGSAWEPVGSPGFTPGQAGYLSLALEGSTPYLSFADSTNSSRVTVMRFTGNEWETVGTPGFSEPFCTYTTIAFDGSTPYVSYRGWFPQKANVMRFNGEIWEMVGSPAFTPSYAQYLTMALDGSTPYIAYLDNVDNYRANVMRFNGTDWEMVGPQNFTTERADNISLKMDGSVPYVSYQDYGNDHKATVQRFNGTEWETVGPPGFSPGRVFFPSLAMDGSTPYVAFMDEKSGYKISVMRFNGTEWETVGTPGFYAGLAFDPTLAMDGSTPYVVFQVIGNSFKTTMMKYDEFPTVTTTNPADRTTILRKNLIKVTFDRDMLHDSSAGAANTTTNYLLVEANEDDFQTESCVTGVAGDDIPIPLLDIAYDNHDGVGPYRATLTTVDRLENGRYRLFVCGTSSIHDASGNLINNGEDSVITFRVKAEEKEVEIEELPKTGFTPGVTTHLPTQGNKNAYQQYPRVSLEIPALDVNAPIVGVPILENGWDLTWLGNQAGWLHGTAFPSWAGNSTITAHVVDANGQPGLFSQIGNLKWGDEIIVHAFGQTYIYEVRTTEKNIQPDDISHVFNHEEFPWLTLITCQGYDANSNSYRWRTAVKAVQTEIR